MRGDAVEYEPYRGLLPAIAQRRLVGTERRRARRDEGFEAEVGDHQHQGLRGGQVRVQVVAHLPATLPLRQQHHEPLDRRREGSGVGAARLREQGHEIRMSGEELELSLEGRPDAFERAVSRERD